MAAVELQGVGKDYTKAVQWKNVAKRLGQDVNE